MTTDRLANRDHYIADHGIETRIVMGRLFALESLTHRDRNDNVQASHEWVDVTDWTNRELVLWLGYDGN